MALRRTHIILHHTGAEEKDARQVRRYHLSKGWRDVGYNFIIERDGRVVRGRSLAMPGAHCAASGMNYRGIGVAVIGNMENRRLTEEQFLALRRLISSIMEEYGIAWENVLLHRDVPGARTRCPGKYFPEVGALQSNEYG
ncbi:peptidoglycan recognition protein family protein [Zhaonella formicivorans]|jgi:N-acetyl-anhydromuramyl-L-alanine amidase AmpD|uniref:peptidoglycan recognition protein family protein n=1 Tax=Zhaonella formicivorans TaxID=2528593 RepID=UPI001D1048B8|nr:peptidoglycan recognition family protein [Zhaonella formicivorans]